MEMNDAGLQLLKSFEGCRLQAYQDQGGIWTIGFGHTGPEVIEGLEWTQDQADNQLKQDLQQFEDGVNNLVEVDINSNQFSALVDFAYNLGLGALKTSFLLKCLNCNNFPGAASQFEKWDHCDGTVIPGLLRRRLAERDLFNTAID